MRFPICQRVCHGSPYDEYGFDPYILCDCQYSRRFPMNNILIAKEMSGSNVTIPIVRSATTPGPSPMNISNSTIITPPRTPISVPSPNIASPMQLSMPNNFSSRATSNIPIFSDQTSEPISSKLTIYSRSGHIVQKYDGGTRMVTLPKSVEIASIVAVGSDGVIIPFSYVPETNMGIALVDRSTGEKVDATVIKEDKILKGKILSLDSDNVMLMSGGEISNIRKYDQVSVGITDDYTRPRLVIKNDIPKAFTLSYLLSSIAWSCVGTALIDKDNNMMYLRLAGNIVNNTESDITADTVLVSGDVYQYRRTQDANAESAQYAPRAMMMARSAPMSGKQVETSMLEDYTKYQVGNRIVRNKDVAELGTASFPVIKLYIHQTNDNDTVRFGYRFTAPGFIPSCSLNVYSIDRDRTVDSYLGSNEIEQSQKNDEIDIILGETTMLQCKSEVIVSDVIVSDEDTARRYNLPLDTFQQSQQQQVIKGFHNDGDWHIITEDLKVVITNHNDTPSALVLKHYIGNKKLVDLRCQSFKDRKNGYIEWYFQIPPKSGSEPRKESFTCQIITASYF